MYIYIYYSWGSLPPGDRYIVQPVGIYYNQMLLSTTSVLSQGLRDARRFPILYVFIRCLTFSRSFEQMLLHSVSSLVLSACQL